MGSPQGVEGVLVAVRAVRINPAGTPAGSTD